MIIKPKLIGNLPKYYVFKDCRPVELEAYKRGFYSVWLMMNNNFYSLVCNDGLWNKEDAYITEKDLESYALATQEQIEFLNLPLREEELV